jgi:sugar phosphate isomerase/epimerase
MHSQLARRQFLKLSLGAGAALAAGPLARFAQAIEPLQRSGPPRFLLSLAAYSFRNYFKEASHEREVDLSRQIDLFDFIDFCAEHGCQGAELTSYYFPQNPTPEFLLRIRRHAFLRGVEISGTAVGNNFALPKGPQRDQQIASVRNWIDHSSVMGAPHIRIFAGPARNLDDAQARRLCIDAIQECCEYAGQKGVFLGLENHGGIVAEAEGLLEIVRAINSPWFGINLDTGNFHTDDPYADLAKCAPYAINVQVKAEIRARNREQEEVDLARIFGMLRDANYQGYVVLEYESAEPWQAVPDWLKRLRTFIEA